MPAAMLEKEVCLEACVMRITECGRHKGFKALCLKSDGSIDWSKRMSYKSTFDGGKLRKVEHVGTGEAVTVTGDRFDQSWGLLDCMFDMQARFEQDGLKKYVHSFFDEGRGPHKWKSGKGRSKTGPMHRLASEAKSLVESRREQQNSAKLEDTCQAVIQTVANDKRRARIAMAMATRKAAGTAGKRTKILKLS